MASFRNGRVLATALPPPKCDDQRREGKNHERIERLEPGHWNFAAEEVAIGILIGPERNGVALLFVGRPEQAYGYEQEQQADN